MQSTDEIGRVARAFDQVHAEAVRLAGNEAQLRGSLNAMFISLSRRSVPLIDRLARMIDVMEQNEDDPDQLANLFSMDHLVTRMRRNSENLLVLAGEEPVRKWTDSVPLTDVARAAASEIEQYSRVALDVQPGIMISGQAAADVVHLLAELIENATLFSPQEHPGPRHRHGAEQRRRALEVRDDGVGVSPNRLADMNWRLDHPPGVDVSISRHMGLLRRVPAGRQARHQGQAPPRHPAGAVRPGLAARQRSPSRSDPRGRQRRGRSASSARDRGCPPPVRAARPGGHARLRAAPHAWCSRAAAGRALAGRASPHADGSPRSWCAAGRPSGGAPGRPPNWRPAPAAAVEARPHSGAGYAAASPARSGRDHGIRPCHGQPRPGLPATGTRGRAGPGRTSARHGRLRRRPAGLRGAGRYPGRLATCSRRPPPRAGPVPGAPFLGRQPAGARRHHGRRQVPRLRTPAGTPRGKSTGPAALPGGGAQPPVRVPAWQP